MARKVYALFVGIDDYAPSVRSLRGCVNDVTHIRTLLAKRINIDKDDFIPETLTNGDATRQKVIDTFTQHLGQAGKEDVALFYYSGHGSTETAPAEFWRWEPDRKNETIVCYDSREPGGWDLADKELAYLIADVAKNGAHVVIILDSCHSGSGTRDAVDDVEAGVLVRMESSDQRTRPIESYILGKAQVDELFSNQTESDKTHWLSMHQGRHILMAACDDRETAKELLLDGKQRGIFSYYLEETLANATGSLSYHTVFKRIEALVPTRVQKQTPVLQATNALDQEQPFLGGAIPRRPPYFTLKPRRGGWVIDGGAVHGVAAPIGDEKMYLAVFPYDYDLTGLNSLKGSVAKAAVEMVYAAESDVSIETNDDNPLPKGSYHGVIVAHPLPPMPVAFEGDADALDLVRTAVAAAEPGNRPSLLVREAPLIEAEYRLRALVVDSPDGQKQVYRISRKADAYPLVVDTAGFDPSSADLVTYRLEHIARWQKIASLNKVADDANGMKDAIRLEFFLVKADGTLEAMDTTGGLRFTYRPPFEPTDYPRFQVKLTNTSEQTYYCMLLNLTQDYSIHTGLLPEGIIRLGPQEEAWGAIRDRRGNLSTEIHVFIPEKLRNQEITQLSDIFKLIVSTDKADATLLAMDSLPVIVERSVMRGFPDTMSTLGRLMGRVHTRDIGVFPDDGDPYSDWFTQQVQSVILWPLSVQPVGQKGEETQLASGVTLSGHPQLKAQVRLGSLDSAGREAGTQLVPALFRDHPDLFQPVEFTTSRGGEPGLAVLELIDVADHTVVTATDSLHLTLDQPLRADEHILPYAYDGDFFLPLGYARPVDGRTEIILERLPQPSGDRDVKGSIKIMFQKMIAEKVGMEYDYPRLAVATIATDGSVTYDPTPAEVKKQVAAAERIVLYIHGIFGDTRDMVASARTTGSADLAIPRLAEQYDLLLAFDYENLHTPIEDTARQLKQRLQDAGLGANHGKILHVVAHSMGGLVTRWFVEAEGGNQVVQHLVTLGTPHKGTPWSRIQDWATTLLVLGLNGLSTVAWPVKIALALVKAVEAIDVTADQFASNSPFIKQLAETSDPGIPLTTIAGNTSIIPAAARAQAGESESLLAKLLARLEQMRLIERAAGLAFLGQPNDIAVSVNSALGLPSTHTSITAIELPCDHMSYFETDVVLRKLADALQAKV